MFIIKKSEKMVLHILHIFLLLQDLASVHKVCPSVSDPGNCNQSIQKISPDVPGEQRGLHPLPHRHRPLGRGQSGPGTLR